MFTLRLLGSASLDGPDGPVSRSRRPAAAHRAAGPPGGRAPPPAQPGHACSPRLWPESGTDEARHLLRDSLYILRSALGDDSVLSTGDDLRLNPARLTCDLWEFEAALARDDPEAAVAVYRGPFLNGFHLSDAEEFEHWADGERSRLARRYSPGARAAGGAGDAGRRPGAGGRVVGASRRRGPYNSRIALRYMQALEAAGDRAGALRHASATPICCARDLDAAPEARGRRLGGEAQARVARRLGRVTPAASRIRSLPRLRPSSRARSTPLAPPVAAPTRPTHRNWVVSGWTRRSHGGGARRDRRDALARAVRQACCPSA